MNVFGADRLCLGCLEISYRLINMVYSMKLILHTCISLSDK